MILVFDLISHSGLFGVSSIRKGSQVPQVRNLIICFHSEACIYSDTQYDQWFLGTLFDNIVERHPHRNYMIQTYKRRRDVILLMSFGIVPVRSFHIKFLREMRGRKSADPMRRKKTWSSKLKLFYEVCTFYYLQYLQMS